MTTLGKAGHGKRVAAGRRVLLRAAAGLVLAQAAPARAARPPQSGAGAPTAPARPPLEAWLREAGVPPEQAGAFVVPVDGTRPLLELQGQRAFNPASTIKLLTCYAALGLLGPDYRWRTGAWLRGQLLGDVLHGDLILKGGGDPKLVIEDLAAFIARMRAQGLRELRGDLVIDDALFDPGPTAGEAFDGDPSQPYNVGPHPLLMNFKSARVVVQPGDRQARIALDPPLADVRIDNEVQLVAGPCRHPAHGLRVREVPATGGQPPRVRVSGAYSSGCGEQAVFAALLGHEDYIHGFFKAAWEASGGSFLGRTRTQRGAAAGRPWLEWVSPRTLVEVVRDINKFSNNVMSRNLLLQLAADPGAGPGGASAAPPGLEASREALGRWLAAQGLRFAELVIDNGSGLSRRERIAPASLAALLRHAAASPVADALRESLPVVGHDGTMRHRLAGEPAAGRAWIKTGSLNDVRSIAGYVDAASGRRLVVVFMANGSAAAASAPVQDRLLRWTHAYG
jgi:D-alanyl-D-alanine carboxypeptidase/D-alanyl-D-alanine-endopeptidase (penicillin-binding protein 4)